MYCKHAEDVCQHCLEKVHTTAEEALPISPTKENSPPEKTMTLRQKRISILMDSSFLAAGGAMWYFYNKQFFKFCTLVFDSILDTISTRNRKE